MQTDMPWLPPDSWWLVRILRFLNLLDDARNVLSPVKINLWASNLTTVCAGAATVMAWLGGNIDHVTALWAPIGTWLAQAHATHHFDKRERNLQSARAKGN